MRISKKGITLEPQPTKKILKNYETDKEPLVAGTSGDVFEVNHKNEGNYAWKINEVTQRFDYIDNTKSFTDEIIALLAVTGHEHAPKLKKAIIEPSGPDGKITTHLMMEVVNKPDKSKYSASYITAVQDKLRIDTGIKINDRINNDPFERIGTDTPVEIDFGDVTFQPKELLSLLKSKANSAETPKWTNP